MSAASRCRACKRRCRRLGARGLLVIRGDAGLRCGISLKGADIVVGGDVGSFSAFMAQAGRLVVCGDAGDGLGIPCTRR